MRPLTLWTIAALLVVMPLGSAFAQQSMMPESLEQIGGTGSGTPLQSTTSTMPSSMLGVDLGTKSNVNADLVGGLNFTQTSQTTRDDVFGKQEAGLPMGYLYHQSKSTQLNFELSPTSHFAYTNTSKQDMNFGLDVRGFENYRGFSFNQGLGSGSSGMTLNFSSGTREKGGAAGSQVTTIQEQAFGLTGGFGSAGTVKLGFSSSTPDDVKQLSTQTLMASLAPKFSGGNGLLSVAQTKSNSLTVDTTQTNTDLVLPMRLAGQVVKTQFHRQSVTGTTNTDATSLGFSTALGMLGKGAMVNFAQSTHTVNGVQTAQTVAQSLAMPLTKFVNGASFAWSDTGTYAGEGDLVNGQSKTDFVLPLKLLDPKASFQWHFASTTKNRVRTDSRRAIFTTPLTHLLLPGGTFSWQSIGGIDAAGNDTLTRTTTIAAPLPHLRKGSSFNLRFVSVDQPGLVGEHRILTLATPVHFASRAIGASYTTETTTTNGADTDQNSLVFGIPVQNQSATYGITHIKPFAADGTAQPQQDITAVNLPAVRVLTNALHAGYAETRTQTEGRPDVVSSTLTSTFTPSKRLSVAGQLKQTDAGPGNQAFSTNLKADYAVMPSLSLNWRYLESQAAGAVAPTAQQYYGLAHQVKGSLPMQMKLGYTTYDTPTELPQDSAMSLQLAVGKPNRTSVTASYSEFDQNSLALLPQEMVTLALTQHLGAAYGLRYSYEDAPGRIAPLRGVTLTGPMLGGNVTLSRVANPQDPRDPKLVRDADQWDAAMKRKLLGFDMDVGYRYCEFRSPVTDVEQFFRVSLAGGKPTGSGRLKFSYLSGDFMPAPAGWQPSLQVSPGSSLELDYDKQWGGAWQLSVGVRRNQDPLNSGLPSSGDTTEGRMELKAQF